jgi:rifampicin phosphotransferase
MQAPWLIPLDQLSVDNANLVGGKAFNLGRLIQAGFMSPPGWVLSTWGYRSFVEQYGLQTEIADTLGDCDVTNPVSLQHTSERIADRFLSCDLSSELMDSLGAALGSLGPSPTVAVRSSGTSEDLPRFSFAGQHDTILNVTGLSATAVAVRRCWASLWSARALQYRSRAGIDHRACAMAVIVQKMLPASAAGVAFTSDPAQPTSRRIIINAARGTGDVVVEGTVTPHSYAVDRQTLRIVGRTTGASDSHEAGQAKLEGEGPSEPLLSSQQVRCIAVASLQIERLNGTPQDIEWALHGNAIHMLQARNITSGEKVDRQSHGILSRLVGEFFYDYFPRPMYHFDTSVMQSLVNHTLGLAADFALRPQKFEEIVRENEDGSLHVLPRPPALSWWTIPCFVPSLARAVATIRRNPDVWVAHCWPRLKQKLRPFEGQSLAQLDYRELVPYTRPRHLSCSPQLFLGWLARHCTFPNVAPVGHRC